MLELVKTITPKLSEIEIAGILIALKTKSETKEEILGAAKAMRDKSLKIFYAKYNAENINSFKNKKVICFAGIGNPINFFELLKKNEINVLDEISFPDHHDYSERELEDLVIKSKKNNAILLTTEKDYLRINENYKENINFLKIKTILIDQGKFINEIKKII